MTLRLQNNSYNQGVIFYPKGGEDFPQFVKVQEMKENASKNQFIKRLKLNTGYFQAIQKASLLQNSLILSKNLLQPSKTEPED